MGKLSMVIVLIILLSISTPNSEPSSGKISVFTTTPVNTINEIEEYNNETVPLFRKFPLHRISTAEITESISPQVQMLDPISHNGTGIKIGVIDNGVNFNIPELSHLTYLKVDKILSQDIIGTRSLMLDSMTVDPISSAHLKRILGWDTLGSDFDPTQFVADNPLLARLITSPNGDDYSGPLQSATTESHWSVEDLTNTDVSSLILSRLYALDEETSFEDKLRNVASERFDFISSSFVDLILQNAYEVEVTVFDKTLGHEVKSLLSININEIEVIVDESLNVYQSFDGIYMPVNMVDESHLNPTIFEILPNQYLSKNLKLLFNYHLYRASYLDFLESLTVAPLLLTSELDPNYIMMSDHRIRLQSLGDPLPDVRIVSNGKAFTIGEVTTYLYLNAMIDGINDRNIFGSTSINAMSQLGYWVASSYTYISDDDVFDLTHPSNYVDYLSGFGFDNIVDYEDLIFGYTGFVSMPISLLMGAPVSSDMLSISIPNIYGGEFYSSIQSLVPKIHSDYDTAYISLYNSFATDKKWYDKEVIFGTNSIRSSFYNTLITQYDSSLAARLMIESMLLKYGLLYYI